MNPNYNLVSFPADRVAALDTLAKELGVLIHIEGIPFGEQVATAKGEQPADG